LKRWCLVAILIKRAAAVPRGMKPWRNMKRSCQKC
jgi:hypothetical protein